MTLTTKEYKSLYFARKKKEGWITYRDIFPRCVLAKVAQYARQCMAEYNAFTPPPDKP
jgi:hypothetical protein